MKKIESTLVAIVVCLLSLAGLFLPIPCAADCSCTIGSNGINVVGLELMATECPLKPYADNRYYTYVVHAVQCDGTRLYRYAFYGDMPGTTAAIIGYFVSQGYRVMRNPSGTHLLAVQNGRYPFSGNILGVNMAGVVPGSYFTDPVTRMDNYCTGSTVPDSDGDGIPDCLEVPKLDLPFNLGAPPCPPSVCSRNVDCSWPTPSSSSRPF